MAQQLRNLSHGRKRRYLLLAFFFALGFLIGISGRDLLAKYLQKKHTALLEIRKEGGYAFIKPLIDCENQEIIPELTNFKNKIADFVREALENKDALDISVYFRDMNNGPSFSINEGTKFIPASLLKVPIMMAYFKKAESDPLILKKMITFNGEATGYSQYFEPTEKLQAGQSYTVEDLIRRMIIYSDNEASGLLVENDKSTFNSVQKDLGIEYWEYDQMQGEMSDKSYAAFFRVLYNASYLTPEMSEKALELLSETQFPFGLAGGIPAGIKIAHKFGERHENLVLQLHDCGIIYHPQYPYLLCVMTRGGDMETLRKIIQQISRLVYDEVDKQASSR